ncbi:MAG TPA: cysteine dioxygenase family protein [Burkholderiales bacterium]|nr:cysteine dioxygenase family protein [Burkholderiales bacterium]
MFDQERFIEDCRAAIRGKDSQNVIRELVARAVSEPAQLMRVIGEPKRAGVETIYKADNLTILNLCWGPGMVFKPHDHHMWAVIGIYTGREENTFFRRAERGLTRHGTKELNAGDVTPLGAAIIHAVTNPLDRITGAIHVYGGDFFAVQRSEWDPRTFEEQPYDMKDTLRAFEESNARLGFKAT